MICRHCERRIVMEDGRWIDPEAPATPADGDDHIWRETCDRHESFVADHEPLGDRGSILHTDAPLMPLTTMVAFDASVEIGQAAGGRKDCFYGWGEAMADAVHCKPHHLVIADDDRMLMTIAEALVAAGHQAVITDYDEWSERQRVLRYDDDHQH